MKVEMQERVMGTSKCVKPACGVPVYTLGKGRRAMHHLLQLYLHRWEITVSSWNGRHNDIRVWGHLQSPVNHAPRNTAPL